VKRTAMSLYNHVYEGPARKHFRWWYGWAVRSRLAPMKEVAGTLKRRFANIITYLKHRITNATSESINAKIQWVKYTARGFRNKRTSSTRSTSTAAASTWPWKPLNSRKRLFLYIRDSNHFGNSNQFSLTCFYSDSILHLCSG